MGVRHVVTRKGQVTLPADMRHALGLKEGDAVEFTLDGGAIVIQRAGSVVDRTYGAIKSGRPPLSIDALRESAMDAIAEGFDERSGPSA